MNLNKPAVIKKLQERFRNVNAGRGLYTAFLVPTMLTMDEGECNHAGCVHSNPRHQHHRSCCYCGYCASSDELLQIWTNG